MSRYRLTDNDRKTIRSALNRAIDERLGYADSWSNEGPVAEVALKQVERFKELYLKMFDEPCAYDQEQAEMAAAKSISILDLANLPPTTGSFGMPAAIEEYDRDLDNGD